MPRALRPQIAVLTHSAPKGDDWLHEIKYDGYRTLCFVDGGEARLLTRNGHDWSDRYQPIGGILSKVRCNQAIIDGEICVQDETGVTSFAALQDALATRAPERLTYFAFDLLYLNGFDLIRTPLIQRKRELKRLLKGVRDSVQYSDHVVGDGPAFFEQAEKLSLEGIVSKRVNAPYRPGKARSWVKTKITDEGNFLVVGYTESTGGLSSLLLAERSKDGSLQYVGKVGTGMSLKEAALLQQALRKISLKRPPKHLQLAGRVGRATWAAPKLTARVRYNTRTAANALRHPVFLGLV